MSEKNAFRAQVEKTLWAGQSSLQTLLGTSLQGERASVSGIKSLVGPAVYRRLCNLILKLELSVFVVVGSVFGKKKWWIYMCKSHHDLVRPPYKQSGVHLPQWGLGTSVTFTMSLSLSVMHRGPLSQQNTAASIRLKRQVDNGEDNFDLRGNQVETSDVYFWLLVTT